MFTWFGDPFGIINSLQVSGEGGEEGRGGGEEGGDISVSTKDEGTGNKLIYNDNINT